MALVTATRLAPLQFLPLPDPMSRTTVAGSAANALRLASLGTDRKDEKNLAGSVSSLLSSNAQETPEQAKTRIFQAFQMLTQKVAQVTAQANVALIDTFIAQRKVLNQQWIALKINQSTSSLSEDISGMNAKLQVELDCLHEVFTLKAKTIAILLRLHQLNVDYIELENAFLNHQAPFEFNEASNTLKIKTQAALDDCNLLLIEINRASRCIGDKALKQMSDPDFMERINAIGEWLNPIALNDGLSNLRNKHLLHKLLHETNLLSLHTLIIINESSLEPIESFLMKIKKFTFNSKGDVKAEMEGMASVLMKFKLIDDVIAKMQKTLQLNPLDLIQYELFFKNCKNDSPLKSESEKRKKLLETTYEEIGERINLLKVFKDFAYRLFKYCEMGHLMRSTRKDQPKRCVHADLFDKAKNIKLNDLNNAYSAASEVLNREEVSEFKSLDGFVMVDANNKDSPVISLAQFQLKDRLWLITSSLWSNSRFAREHTELERMRMEKALNDSTAASDSITYIPEKAFMLGGAAHSMMQSAGSLVGSAFSSLSLLMSSPSIASTPAEDPPLFALPPPAKTTDRKQSK